MSKSLTELKNKNTNLYMKIKDIDIEIEVIRGLLYSYKGVSELIDLDVKECIISCVKKRNKLVMQHNKISFILNILEQDIKFNTRRREYSQYDEFIICNGNIK